MWKDFKADLLKFKPKKKKILVGLAISTLSEDDVRVYALSVGN